MFGLVKKWIIGFPKAGPICFQPSQPSREKAFWHAAEITAFGDVDEMLRAGVVKLWRSDSSGSWYTSDRESLSWWEAIND
jgi:hypothetical protein